MPGADVDPRARTSRCATWSTRCSSARRRATCSTRQQPLTGVRSTSFSASDQGGGVYQALLEADGQVVASTVVDANGGNCVPPFKGAVPCKPSTSGTLSFDTSALADGAHALRLVVTDPTGTNSAAYGPVQVRTLNQTAECDPTVSSAATPVSARHQGHAPQRGHAASGRGTVTWPGRGRRGRRRRQPAQPRAADRRAGDRGRDDDHRRDGAFSLPVAAGPSRRLRAGWRTAAGSRFVVCSKPLDIRVPARGRR